MAAGSVRPSYESLQEKLLVSADEVLYYFIDKDTLPSLNGFEIVHTGFWILIDNMKITPCRVECSPLDDNIRHH